MFAWPRQIKSGLGSLSVEITFFPFLPPPLPLSLSLFLPCGPPFFFFSYPPILKFFFFHFLFSTFHYSVLWNCGFLLISACLNSVISNVITQETIFSFLLYLMDTVDQTPNSATDVQFRGRRRPLQRGCLAFLLIFFQCCFPSILLLTLFLVLEGAFLGWTYRY